MQKTTSERGHFPTATAMEHRLRLFQATRRPKNVEQTIISPWGKVRTKGRLGQAHADVFEAMCFDRETAAQMQDGGVKLLIDPAKIRRRAGQTSGSTFQGIVDDLQQTLIEIVEPVEMACQGQLLGHIDKARRRDGSYVTARNPLGGERHLWKVEIGKAFLRLVEADIWIGYDPAPIAALGHGISQAIVRHIHTHRNEPVGGWKLDGLIETVAGKVAYQAKKDRRREIRADAEGMECCGILIDGERVRVEQKPG